jgi:hypothetical protein
MLSSRTEFDCINVFACVTPSVSTTTVSVTVDVRTVAYMYFVQLLCARLEVLSVVTVKVLSCGV